MDEYLEKIKEAALTEMAGEKVKIILFGSRGRRDNHATSDVDIGLIPYGEFNRNKLVFLKNKIEDLNVPYKVDIVNFSEVSSDFKKEALKGAVVWKD